METPEGLEVKHTLKALGKLEKEFAPIHAALQKLTARESSTPNAEAAAASTAKIKQRVLEIYTKADGLCQKIDAQCRQCTSEDPAARLKEDVFESTLQRDIVDYLIWRGHVSVAQKCASAFGFPVNYFPLLRELTQNATPISNLIRDLREKHDCTLAIQWCLENRDALGELNHNLLEVELRIQELLQLCIRSRGSGDAGGMERLSFIAANLLPFAVHHPQLVQDVTTCATHDSAENYKGMYDECHWDAVVSQLLHDWVALFRTPRNGEAHPPLVLRCVAGVAGLKDILPVPEKQPKGSPRGSGTPSLSCPSQLAVDSTLRQLVASVMPGESTGGVSVKRQTRLFCRVTGKETTNPVVLPNGTVLSDEGFELLRAEAREEGSEIPKGKVRCPRTQELVSVFGVRRMFIV